jgi:hypothetical protein
MDEIVDEVPHAARLDLPSLLKKDLPSPRVFSSPGCSRLSVKVYDASTVSTRSSIV